MAAAGAVALGAYTSKVFGKVMLALMLAQRFAINQTVFWPESLSASLFFLDIALLCLRKTALHTKRFILRIQSGHYKIVTLGCTIKDLYDATAEPINLYERTRRYVKDMTVLFFTAMAEQYLEKVTEKVITKLSDTKFVRGFMDFVMEEDLLTGISDRILLARMYFAESDAEVFGKLSKYLEEDALTYLNAEIGKTELKPRDVAKTLLKCVRKNDDTTLSLDDARFVLRELRLGTEESVVVSLFVGGRVGGTKYDNIIIDELKISDIDELNRIINDIRVNGGSPIEIAENASVDARTMNKGYQQIKYQWSEGIYKYESRWHTETPGAVQYARGTTWVVTRTIPGNAQGQTKMVEYLVGDSWIDKSIWRAAVKANMKGTATVEQQKLLQNGHWLAK